MKLVLSSGGVVREATVVRRGDLVHVTLHGDEERTVVLRVGRGPRGRLVIEADDQRLEAVGARGPREHERQMWLSGRLLTYRRETAGATRTAGNDLGLAAPIPAVVLEILVAPGDQVEDGQRLVLLESMKMVLPVSASRAGRVDAILCREGDAVEPGVPLLEFTPDGAPDAEASP